MNHFSYFFAPESVRLTLTNQEKSAAIEEVVKLFKQDPRVTQWNEFSQAIAMLPPAPLKVDEENAVLIYHVRTNSVQDLVMAAGRSVPGILFQEAEQPVRLLIMMGIPHALNQEYLRVLGSLARLLKDPMIFKKLLTTENIDEFTSLLNQHYE